MATVDGEPYLGIASFGFDSDANRIANEARLVKGNVVYLYAALRALLGWRDASFTLTVDGERHEVSGYSIGVCNSTRLRWRHVRRPARGARRRPGRRARARHDLEAALPVRPDAEGLQGQSPLGARRAGVARKTIELAADRPFTIYADGDPIGQVPARVEVEPRCLRVIVPALMFRPLAPARPRGPRAQPPARPRRRDDAARPAAAARQPGRAGPDGQGARRRRRGRLGDQRQDDDLGDGRGDPRALRRAGRPQQRRLEHGLGRRDGAARRRAAARGQLGLFEVDEAWLPQVAGALHPEHLPAGEPLPRPARPLRRARDARRRLGGPRRRAGRQGALRAQRRRPARRRPRPRPRGRRLLRRRGRLAGAARAAARRRLQALPQLRRGLRLRRDLPRPPRPLPLPAAAARSRPEPAVVATRVALRRDARRARHAAHAGRARSTSGSPSPASTTSTTPSRPPRWRSTSARRSTTSSRRSTGFGGAFGRVETIAVPHPPAASARSRSC